MHHLFGFVCVCALGVVPQSASAQTGDEGTGAEPNLQEAAPEGPVLQLQLDDAGVEVVSSPPRTPDGYALEGMELRVKRAKIGLGVSAGALVVGSVLVGVALPNLSCEEPASGGNCPIPRWSLPVFVTGVTLAAGGVLGLIASGVLLGVRKRKLRRLHEAHYERARRVQWDLAQSRLVF